MAELAGGVSPEGQDLPIVDLDITNGHLHSLEEVELPNTLEVRVLCRPAPAPGPAGMGTQRMPTTSQPARAAAQSWTRSNHRNTPPCLQSLDVTANRLKRLEDKVLALRRLRRLCLRQNLLTEAEDIERLASAPGKWGPGMRKKRRGGWGEVGIEGRMAWCVQGPRR